jgi:5-formyltetrahydrofolate cyclo-ligase
MTKQELRSKYRFLRQDLDLESIDELSRACFTMLFANFDLSRKNVAIFLPIQSKKEPNTFLLMSEFLVENLKYFAPKIDLSLNKMNFYSIENENQIEYGPYQIPEPKSHYKIELNELDFILIPLLCYFGSGI